MSDSSPSTPWYQARWFWILALVMLGLRLGYKLWQQEQRPSTETTMERLNERNRSLQEQLRAAEAAHPATVVVADSAVLADSAAASR